MVGLFQVGEVSGTPVPSNSHQMIADLISMATCAAAEALRSR